MTAEVIDCERIAQRLLTDVHAELTRLRDADIEVGVATVVVGENDVAVADQLRLEQLASGLGIAHEPLRIDGAAAEAEVVESIRAVGEAGGIGAIVVLGSLPRHVDESAAHGAVDPHMDVDAVHPENLGLLAAGRPRYVSSTAMAAYEVLDAWVAEQGHDTGDFYRRARVVVVGGVNRVATSALLLGCARHAPVASVDPATSGSDQLGWYTRHADVLLVAAGIPRLIRAEHVRPGAIVLDAGGTLIHDGDVGGHGVLGDVAVEEVLGRARAVTPALNGIGVVRDAVLMRSIVRAVRADALPRVPVVHELS